MTARHVSVDISLPRLAWDSGQQRMPTFPQLPSSAANFTWLQQHFPFPVKGQLITSLLLAHRVPVQRVPPVQTPSQHCPCWRYGSPSPRQF
jgi:hypothetical protein